MPRRRIERNLQADDVHMLSHLTDVGMEGEAELLLECGVEPVPLRVVELKSEGREPPEHPTADPSGAGLEEWQQRRQ